MVRKRKSGKGGDSHHVRLYRWELKSPAYRSLSLGARALLVEMKALYNGNNNGLLFMSVREAAQRLNRPKGKNLAAKLFAELQAKGFIRPHTVGRYTVKTDAAGRRATSWILTEFAFAGGLPKRDFMRWRPGDEAIFAVPPAVRAVPTRGTIATDSGCSVPTTGHFCPENQNRGPHQRDTGKLPRGVVSP